MNLDWVFWCLDGLAIDSLSILVASSEGYDEAMHILLSAG